MNDLSDNKSVTIYVNDAFEKDNTIEINVATENDNLGKTRNITKVQDLNGDVHNNDLEEINNSVDQSSNESENNLLGNFILSTRKKLLELYNMEILHKIKLWLLVIGFLLYFGLSMYYNNPFNYPKDVNSTTLIDNYVFSNNKGLALVVITFSTSVMLLYETFILKQNKVFERVIKMFETNIKSKLNKNIIKNFNWIVLLLIIAACLIYLLISLTDYYNFMSLFGLCALVFIAAFLSVNPAKIKWYSLIVGVLIQFLLGVLVVRVYFGYKLFKFLGDKIESFLRYADFGSMLVFGDEYYKHFMAMAACPVGLFFAGFVSLLYYFGAMQYIILKVSWAITKLMGTTPTESMTAVSSIFLGQSEAPLLIKPFLDSMTISELFSVMLAGFATVSGGVLAAFISYGVPANHLLIASLMSAPAGLAISKVIYPETKSTKADWEAIKKLQVTTAKNVYEAFSLGACAMIGPIAAIITNLIVFTGLFEFINEVVEWIFSLINLENFGLVDILQYPFIPIALLMGCHLEDCPNVAKFVAKKIFISEFIAYKSLGDVINFRKEIIFNNTYELYRNHTLEVPKHILMIWNDRSLVISTYALCGFSNFAAIGICIGVLSALAPKRSNVFSILAAKAMIGGNIACFMTACITGLLYEVKN